MKKYDIIIIGGGPAGSTSGKVLADSGENCLIIDKDNFPRDKLCGGMITEKTMELIKKIYSDVDDKDFIDSSYDTFGISNANNERICECSHVSKRMYFVNRITFDDYLFNKAKESGCKILTGKRVLGIKKQSNEFIITLETGEKFVSRILVGADGANSVVRKNFYFPENKNDYTIAIETEIKYADTSFFDDKKILPEIFVGVLNNGYGWIFPKKEKVIVGIGGPVSKNSNNIRETFVDFLDKITNKEFPELEIKGFPVPFHNFVKTPAKDNVLLVGDAAGFVEAITGEGIYFAIKSGRLAAEAIISNGDIVENYNRSTQKDVIKFLKQSHFVKKFFFHKVLLSYELRKMKNNNKYAKYYFELLLGDIDYWGYFKKVIFNKK